MLEKQHLARAALGRKQNAEKISECLTLGEQTLFIELSQKIINALTPEKSRDLLWGITSSLRD